jgi:hypothetical protein
MEPDWYRATYLIETLVKKARGQDENGMDLSFTVEKEDRPPTNDHVKFQMEMAEHRPTRGTRYDIVAKLDEILNKRLRFIKHHGRSAAVKALTLIILTDGVWAATPNKNSVAQRFVDFINDVRECRAKDGDKLISIQFIQFGNDRDGTRVLKDLDDNMGYANIP